MSERELIIAKDNLASEKAKINRFLAHLATYESDMDFTPTTIIEANLKDTLADIFKAAHKMKGR